MQDCLQCIFFYPKEITNFFGSFILYTVTSLCFVCDFFPLGFDRMPDKNN